MGSPGRGGESPGEARHKARASPCHRQQSQYSDSPCPRQAWAGSAPGEQNKACSGPPARAQAPRRGRDTPTQPPSSARFKTRWQTACSHATTRHGPRNTAQWTRHRTTETQRCPRDAAAGPLLTLSLSLPGGPGPRAPGAGGDDTRGLHPLRTGPGPEVGARIPATAARWCTRQASFRTKPDTQDSAPWKHHRSRWGLGRREPPLESHRFSETTCRRHTKGCSSLRKAAGQNRQARGACFRSVKSGAREKESVTLPELPPSVSTCPSTKERGPSAWGPSFTYTLAR